MRRIHWRSDTTIGILALLGVALILVGVLATPTVSVGLTANAAALLGLGATLVLTDQLRESGDELAVSSPMAAAVGQAMAMGYSLAGRQLTYSAAQAALTILLALTVGSFLHRHAWLPGGYRPAVEVILRWIPLAVLALGVRTLPLVEGVPLVDAAREWPGWLAAIVFVVASLIGFMVEVLVRSVPRSIRDLVTWQRAIEAEASSLSVLAVALGATGVLIVLAMPVLGLVAVPLLMLPLGLTQIASRRHAAIRSTYEQAFLALGRMPEYFGVVPSGHAQQVAVLSVAVARALAMPEREVTALRQAALLHDVGQLRLRHPLPGGSTTSAAPADAERIAEDGADVARALDLPGSTAEIVAQQAQRYHLVVEGLGEVPQASRVIKVVNAYVDILNESMLSGADIDPEDAHARALERISLGLGYEYDPAVVRALEGTVARGL